MVPCTSQHLRVRLRLRCIIEETVCPRRAWCLHSRTPVDEKRGRPGMWMCPGDGRTNGSTWAAETHATLRDLLYGVVRNLDTSSVVASRTSPGWDTSSFGASRSRSRLGYLKFVASWSGSRLGYLKLCGFAVICGFTVKIPLKIHQVLWLRRQGPGWDISSLWLRNQDPGWGTSSLWLRGQDPGWDTSSLWLRCQDSGWGTSRFVASQTRSADSVPQVLWLRGQDPGWDTSSL